MPGQKSIHTKKFDSCVSAVKRKNKNVNPYSICMRAIGYKGSVKKTHRKK